MCASSHFTPIEVLLQHLHECGNGDFLRSHIDPVISPIHNDYCDQITQAHREICKQFRKKGKGFTALSEYEALVAAESFSCENAAFLAGVQYAFRLAGMASGHVAIQHSATVHLCP